MKFLKTTLIVILMFTPVLLFGQILDASNNVPKQELVLQDNLLQLQPVRMNNSVIDEYGEGNNNTFLGGLGADTSYLAVPDAGGLYNLTTGGTVEAWIMPTATTSSAPAIVAKGDISNLSFLIYWQSSTSLLGFRVGSTPGTNTGGTLVPLNVWSHIAVTWAGTPGNYTVTFYVNGAISGAPVVNTGTFNAATLVDSLTIGSTKVNFSGKAFYGYIDEVKIWNFDRTATQIAQSRFVGIGDYTGANTGNAITSAANYTGLISSWTMNNNTRDDIGGKNGFLRKSAGLYWFPYTAGYPIPYNYAFAGTAAAGVNDYVTIPDNTALEQTTAGTFEAWVYLNSTATMMGIFQKGAAFASTTLAAYVSSSHFGINIGAHNYWSTSSPITLTANKWYHLSATWTGGPNFTVNTYVNGQPDYTGTYNLAMPTATGPAWIGRYYGTQRMNGFIDEVRIWSGARTLDEIKSTMFTSCRALLPNANLKGAWNFDGNLKNFSATTGIDGSFSTGGVNNCRLSAYSNESTTGAIPNVQFAAHPTVLSSAGYPKGFTQRYNNTAIPDNASMTDTIKAIGFPGNLNDIQVFLNIQHQKASDITVKLKAPNNTEVILSAAQGGLSINGYLTIFDDTLGNLITSAIYLSPWSQYVKPQNAMGTFGSTVLNGNWVLTVTDGAAGSTGNLLGWGVRFNNSLLVSAGNISTVLPDKFMLYQNYPNPFNPVTKIRFEVPLNKGGSGVVSLKIYNILGKEIATLVNGNLSAGTYEKQWNAENFASGIYFCKLTSGNFSDTKKLTLIK